LHFKQSLEVHTRFDEAFYRHQCSNVGIKPEPSPLEHYLTTGWKTGLKPHPWVDPVWMRSQYPCLEEPLTALMLSGGNEEDPQLTHPRGKLMNAALLGPQSKSILPKLLVDLLFEWNQQGVWPAARWLESDALEIPLPSFIQMHPHASSCLALGLYPDPAIDTTPQAHPPKWLDVAPPPWPAICMLAGMPSSQVSDSRLWTLHDTSDRNVWLAGKMPGDWVINLDWPSLDEMSAWIQGLRSMWKVLDPDPERVGFLQLFGVRAQHQALHPVTYHPVPREELLKHAQLKLGLVDPRWLLSPEHKVLELAVLGSSGVNHERRWGRIGFSQHANCLLLLPRIGSIVLQQIDDVHALQAWLDQLADSCKIILQLEPIALGACKLRQLPNVLSVNESLEYEHDIIEQWETGNS
jgi:hypothetical protein